MSEAYRKKLIEVALPLEAINRESAREKAIRHGHPSTLHLWWARRPLAACRAVLFASIVDDPSSRPEEFPTEDDQQRERERLFGIIEELVKWENSKDERVLEQARAEIRKATNDKPPVVLDPFCGGGAIPLEAQRLGLVVHASDLNPVAVLITKALIEIPPKFVGRPPVNPESLDRLGHGATWRGAQGLCEDIRYYGQWMGMEAFKRIGHLYPTAKLPNGTGVTVVAWLWARTVVCPNPACGARLPLVRSFVLSKKKGKEAFVDPIINREKKTVRFDVSEGSHAPGGTINRRGATCIFCGSGVPFGHIRSQGKGGRLGVQLMAIVAEGNRRRLFLPPSDEQEAIAREAEPRDVPDTDLPARALGFRVQAYGLTRHRDLFTDRQLVAMSTLSELVASARQRVAEDSSDRAYADAVATYLALAVSKTANRCNTIGPWMVSVECPGHMFSRQTVSMSWDFAEANVLRGPSGSFASMLENTVIGLESGDLASVAIGEARQLDVVAAINRSSNALICTDPPYYDNIGYADLSDVFYVWLRKAAFEIFPDVLSTLLTPKAQELIASPERFDGDRSQADRFFEAGMKSFFEAAREHGSRDFPFSLFYAFRQADDGDGDAVVSTGWEIMLEGLLGAGMTVAGTWPMRSERGARARALGSNALASSVVLVCRPRATDASLATRRDFTASLKNELPTALRNLQHGNIAPVDLAQAAIGPGMAIFSRYAKVVEADGSPMTVRTALGLINAALDEILAEQEGDFDADTRFAIAWFEQYGIDEGAFGQADVLARAKNTSVGGLEQAGVLDAGRGRVRLLRREELPDAWDPAVDRRLTVWEVTQHLIQRLESRGEIDAADLLGRVGGLGQTARELAYRLYSISERKGWAQEALGYNALVVSWPEIARLAAEQATGSAQQTLGV